MDLTISIVNWNVKDDLALCLESIRRHAAGVEHEVVVVDNASNDGSPAMVKERFPEVRLIESPENEGYGRGHNQALAWAQGRHVLFLNPDTELLPDTLSRTVRFMDLHPDAGACACREIETADEPPDLVMDLTKIERLLWSLCGRVQRVLPNRLTEGWLMRRIVRTRARLLRAGEGGEEESFDCPGRMRIYLEGGFLLARKAAVDQAGGFDPTIFLGGEGGVLTRRMKERGWKLAYLPYVRVIHRRHRSHAGLTEAGLLAMEAEWEARTGR